MSYFEKNYILAADSPSIDAFGKWRVSQPTTLFDSKQIVDSGSFTFDTKNYGGATGKWNSGSADTTLTVTNISGSRSIRQTKRIFVYQPGKSQQIILTSKFGTGVNGIIKTIGSFDSDDGFMFQQSGSSFGIVLRKKMDGVKSEVFVSQSQWNLDKLNGTGPSGNTIDLTKIQIYTMDYEWLGAGRVRYGVVQKGVLIYVHEITNYNNLEKVYLRNPNLPIRYEIATHKTTSVGSTLTQVCSTVISEGGFDKTGFRHVISNSTGSAVSTLQYKGILAVRYNRNSSNCGQIIPEQVDFLIAPGNNSPFNGRWDLLLNPTFSNNNLLWTDVDTTKIAQQATGSLITDRGTVLASGYFAGTSGVGVGNNVTLDPYYGLGRKIDGTSDILVLAVKALNNDFSVYSNIVIRELG